MEKIRNWLLENGKVQLYELILSFMKSPDRISIDEIVDATPDEIQSDVKKELNVIMNHYSNNRQQYHSQYSLGQVVIWSEILKAYIELTKQKRIIDQTTLSPDLSSYATAVAELNQLLIPYAKMQIALSDLEEVLGVDRFLDRVSEGTFLVLRRILGNAKNELEKKAERYKSVFQLDYSTKNIKNVIAHALVRREDDNQICDQFSSNSDQTILLLIDGFGYCQYLWNRGIESNKEFFTFRENLFSWLAANHLSKNLVLGSSFITDTGAGLAQIFLGQSSQETNIIASKIRERGKSIPFIDTKRVSQAEFNSLFRYSNSITDIISTCKETPIVYYCSKYQGPPSGFSSCIFKSAEVRQVIPSERVFSLVLNEMLRGQTSGLQVIYLTNIDNSGHPMGAYSAFERYEHLKIDCLLRNFLIELAAKLPSAFNGKRSILITADHGMYESSKIAVSRADISGYLNQCGARDVRIVENNRALLIYNEGHADNESIAQWLKDYFKGIRVLVNVQTKGDPDFVKCIGAERTCITPDVVVRFVSEGLFYSNQNANEHLLHFGGHGGFSIDEVFVPLVEIPLDQLLLDNIATRFLSKQ